MERKGFVILAVAPACIVLAFAIPYAIKTYKHGRATEAEKEVSSLNEELNKQLSETKKNVRESYLMPVEKQELERQLAGAENKITGFKQRLANAARDIAAGKYDEARDAFAALKTDITLELQSVKGVAEFCATALAFRNAVMKNEMYLKARLKKPYPFRDNESELPAELAMIPKEFLSYIPRASQNLEEKMRILELGPELENSMGAALVRAKPTLHHIQKNAKKESIKINARQFFAEALKNYTQVRAKNDALPLWYRTEHDGTLRSEFITTLRKGQEEAIALITAGDTALANLESYNQLLHTQECVYVWGHSYKKKSFGHTGTRPSFDSDGNITTETYEYTTEGREFFCIKRTATAQSMTVNTVRVGEIDDPVAMWNWPPYQVVGFVERWKPLHDDQVYTGTLDSLKPTIEEEIPNLTDDPFEKK